MRNLLRVMRRDSHSTFAVRFRVHNSDSRISSAARWLLAFTAGALLLCPASLLAGNEPKTPNIYTVDGSKIFHEYCATCHGANGKGNGPVARALKNKVPDLTQIAKRSGGKFPSDRIREIIEGTETSSGHGSREMPVWGPVFHKVGADQDLGNVRTDNVTKYIQSLQEK